MKKDQRHRQEKKTKSQPGREPEQDAGNKPQPDISIQPESPWWRNDSPGAREVQ